MYTGNSQGPSGDRHREICLKKTGYKSLLFPMGQYCILLRIFFTADKYIYRGGSRGRVQGVRTFYAHEVDEVYLHITESLYRVTG